MGAIIDRTAGAFRDGTHLYVDPDVDPPVSPSELSEIEDQARDANVFIAYVPGQAIRDEATDSADVAGEVIDAARVPGTFLIDYDDSTGNVGSTQIPPEQARSLASAALSDAGDDTAAFYRDFIARVADVRAGGDGTPSEGVSVAGWAVPLGLVAGAGGVGWIIWRRAKRQREEAERAQLEKLRTVIDQDITAYGEELDRLDLDLRSPTVTDQTRTDYGRALDLYESAKQQTVDAKHPEDVQSVTTALEEGRYLLVKVEAESAGRPVPERRPPCFFDPRHGPSTEDVEWSPPMGMPRLVPACAADAIRIKEGAEPDVRMVPVGGRDRPYYEAGGAYGPWAGGYFSGGLLPGLFWGTVIGSSWGGFGGYGDGGGGGDWGGGGGGDWGGGGGGDFGGGDFGGFGGGDF